MSSKLYFTGMISEGVRAATKNGGFTAYMFGGTDRKNPSPGTRGVLTPFPSENFKLTTVEHQAEVRKIVEEAGYDLYVPD